MRNLMKNSLIFITMTTFLFTLRACSESDSSGKDVSGSTSEPNADPIASDTSRQLTEEQKIFLQNYFTVLLDTVNWSSSSKCEIDCDIWREETIQSKVEKKVLYPFTKNPPEEAMFFKSKDERRECSVETYPNYPSVVSHRIMENDTSVYPNSIVSGRIAEKDSKKVFIKTVGTEFWNGFWGFDYTCSEYLDIFKDECEGENGVFQDFRNGCSDSILMVGCATFIPDSSSAEQILSSYKEDHAEFCKQDSAWYSSLDNKE